MNISRKTLYDLYSDMMYNNEMKVEYLTLPETELADFARAYGLELKSDEMRDFKQTRERWRGREELVDDDMERVVAGCTSGFLKEAWSQAWQCNTATNMRIPDTDSFQFNENGLLLRSSLGHS